MADEQRPGPPARRRRDAGRDDVHLHRQDRHADPEPDVRGRGRHPGGRGHDRRRRLRPGRRRWRARPRPGALLPASPRTAAALRDRPGRRVPSRGVWQPEGDPMEAALALPGPARCGVDGSGAGPSRRRPYSPDRMVSSHWSGDDGVGARRTRAGASTGARAVPRGRSRDELVRLTVAGTPGPRGRASRTWSAADGEDAVETGLELLGLLARRGPAPARTSRRPWPPAARADIRVAMLTGDHPRTAEAIAPGGRPPGRRTGSSSSGADLPDGRGRAGRPARPPGRRRRGPGDPGRQVPDRRGAARPRPRGGHDRRRRQRRPGAARGRRRRRHGRAAAATSPASRPTWSCSTTTSRPS